MSTFKTSLIEKEQATGGIKDWILEYVFTPASMGISNFKTAEIRIVSAKFKLVHGGALSMEMMPYLYYNQRAQFIEHCYQDYLELKNREEQRHNTGVSKLHDDAKIMWEKQQSILTPAEVKENYESNPSDFPTLARQMHEGNGLDLSQVWHPDFEQEF